MEISFLTIRHNITKDGDESQHIAQMTTEVSSAYLGKAQSDG
jgi:hypothetical protein